MRGTLALALCLLLAPAAAQAKKVTETAPGVLLPTRAPAFPVRAGEATQTFKLNGSKVKGKQVLDVNLTLNASERDRSCSRNRVILIGPKGDEADLFSPSAAPRLADLKLDDQSNLRSCNPTQINDPSICNYLQGQTATGSVNARINPIFKAPTRRGRGRSSSSTIARTQIRRPPSASRRSR